MLPRAFTPRPLSILRLSFDLHHLLLVPRNFISFLCLPSWNSFPVLRRFSSVPISQALCIDQRSPRPVTNVRSTLLRVQVLQWFPRPFLRTFIIIFHLGVRSYRTAFSFCRFIPPISKSAPTPPWIVACCHYSECFWCCSICFTGSHFSSLPSSLFQPPFHSYSCFIRYTKPLFAPWQHCFMIPSISCLQFIWMHGDALGIRRPFTVRNT